MKKINSYGDFIIYQLDKETAHMHADTLTRLIDTIPLVKYTKEDVLAEAKPGRPFHGKWEHSLIMFEKNKPIAVIMGYERTKEENNQYPENCLYISELAVDETYRRQGIARNLLKNFLDFNNKLLHLEGGLSFSIQTNSADWNQHVINLYKSFSFKQIATKEYDNRVDVVLNLKMK